MTSFLLSPHLSVDESRDNLAAGRGFPELCLCAIPGAVSPEEGSYIG